MLNDLLWKLLGGLGLKKEETIRIGNWPSEQPKAQIPSSSPVAQYVAPTAKPIEQYTSLPTPQGYSGYGRKPETKNVADPVYGAINQAATKFQVPLGFMLDLAFTESSLDPKKTNVDAPDINPSGLYQFTNSTWDEVLKHAHNPESSLYGVLPSEDRFDPLTNSLAAAYLIKMGQLGKWDASEWNWGNEWTPKELEDLGFYKQSKYHIPGMRASVRLAGGKE